MVLGAPAARIWTLLGRRAASMGTLGVVAPDYEKPGSLTTPDPVTMHQELQRLATGGVSHVCLEASSHGLDQFRLDGLELRIAAFTNLTRDHLDYHETMAAYLNAKARLFDVVMKPGGTAVLNADVPETGELVVLCHRHGHRVITFGESEDAELRLLQRHAGPGEIGARVLHVGVEEAPVEVVREVVVMRHVAA